MRGTWGARTKQKIEASGPPNARCIHALAKPLASYGLYSSATACTPKGR